MGVKQTKVTVNVRDDLLEGARKIADKENKTVTEVINEALRVRELAADQQLLVKPHNSDELQIVLFP